MVNAGDKVPFVADFAVMAAAFDKTVKSVRVTIAEVRVPQELVNTTLYLVPVAGTVVVVLIMFKVAVVDPE